MKDRFSPMLPQTSVDFDNSPDAPWWIRPLYIFGIPAGIAVFLVYFLTATVVNGQTKIQDTLDHHMREQARQILLLQLICRNTAQTERERAQCEVSQ
jgi:hypothetical protein